MQADWKQVDRELRRLARSRAAMDYEEGQWLLEARRTAVHSHLGFASLAEYAERVLGHDRRTTAERLRVAEALGELPETSGALRQGKTSWSAVRELSRVIVPETEQEWLAAARGKTVREVEEMVSGRRPGDRPQDPGDPNLKRTTVRFELLPEALATLREAIGRLRREVDPRLSNEDAILEMARRVLSGPRDDGRSPYQIALTVCKGCERTWQQGGPDAIEVDDAVSERARCDAQEVDTHVGHAAPARASQTIPPRIRRLVVRRARGRCQVPGCRNTAWLEVHHVRPRAEGGTHDPDGLILLCGTHHRLQHRGFLLVEGTASAGFTFRHADGTPYGAPITPSSIETSTEAFAALRSLGFKETEARRLLLEANTHVGTGATTEEVVRAALKLRQGQTRSYVMRAREAWGEYRYWRGGSDPHVGSVASA